MKDISIITLAMILLCIISVVAASPVTCTKKSKPGRKIQLEDLPAEIQHLLKETCSGVCSPPEYLTYRGKYCVVFHNGERWFDEQGELIKACYLFTQLTEGLRTLLPGKIRMLVAEHYPGTYISGFERTKEGYTLFVFGQVDGELYFDTDGEIRIPGKDKNKSVKSVRLQTVGDFATGERF